MRGKCNCGKKATSTWIIYEPPKGKTKYGCAREISWCNDCKPSRSTETIYEI